LDLAALQLIQIAAHQSSRLFERLTALTLTQYFILEALAGESQSQCQIEVVSGIDRSTVSDVIRRLQRQKLVSKRRSTRDARSYNVSLTPEGRKYLIKGRVAIQSADETLLQVLPSSSRKQFVADISAILAAE
jgi:DNA-binding MarR family transcriptional regulator